MKKKFKYICQHFGIFPMDYSNDFFLVDLVLQIWNWTPIKPVLKHKYHICEQGYDGCQTHTNPLCAFFTHDTNNGIYFAALHTLVL